jgi:hypothetical protein
MSVKIKLNLQNEELHNLYSSSDIIRMNKSSRMSCMRCPGAPGYQAANMSQCRKHDTKNRKM